VTRIRPYRPPRAGIGAGIQATGGDWSREIPPDLCRGPGVVSLEQPLVVVPPLELLEGLDQLGDGGEVADPKPVPFEGPDEAFRDAVGLLSRMHTIRSISPDVSVGSFPFIPCRGGNSPSWPTGTTGAKTAPPASRTGANSCQGGIAGIRRL
jgi:hypothetical protein